MITRKISYKDREFEMEYLFEKDVAIQEAGNHGRFMELPLLKEIERREIEGIYIDGGANIGNHTIFFHEFCPTRGVIVIEGHPQIFEVLERNLARVRSDAKPRIGAWNKALWRPGQKTCHMGRVVPGNAGRTKVYMGGDQFAPTKDVEVECVTLDEIFSFVVGAAAVAPSLDRDKVGLLKLDIEDSEVFAIKGARQLLEMDRPLIIAEHHNEKFFNDFKAEVEPFGYKPGLRFAPRGETVIWEPSS